MHAGLFSMWQGEGSRKVLSRQNPWTKIIDEGAISVGIADKDVAA